ncbi:hypothetical protein [Desertivirga brevis]|uniref:hypothetical protein n=1 Tax=Desertivirga brevis TaxID=2810310 RepID=UPI001A96BB01|nr:hypothetical protein [Pedobacter sp. SYSU D00873]
MMRKLLLVILLLNCLSTTKAQSLNWFVSAHVGTSNYKTASMNGAVMGGFKNEMGQQVSIGPVVKGYMLNGIVKNQVGARLYAQMNLSGKIDAYIQCDASDATQFRTAPGKSPVRLETGMGLNFMIKENLGVGCGYTFGEINPLSNQRLSSPSLKIVYVLPFLSNSRW